MKKGWIPALAVAVALDQLAKMWADRVLPAHPGGALAAWPGVFGWQYAKNTGAAFSAMSGRQLLLIIVTSALIAGALLYLTFNRDLARSPRLGLTLIAAGGLGNLIDRARNGYVIDYIKFLFVEFPIFNLADIFITSGVTVIIIWLFATGGEQFGRKRLSD